MALNIQCHFYILDTAEISLWFRFQLHFSFLLLQNLPKVSLPNPGGSNYAKTSARISRKDNKGNKHIQVHKYSCELSQTLLCTQRDDVYSQGALLKLWEGLNYTKVIISSKSELQNIKSSNYCRISAEQ